MAGSNGPSPAKKAKTELNGVFSRHSVCLVLDYGSQYTQLIARRVRDNGVLSVLLPGDVTMVSREMYNLENTRNIIKIHAVHIDAFCPKFKIQNFRRPTN